MAFNRAFAFRVAMHLATWLPFLYGGASALQHQWRPISDNASIAIRSWDVLTSHGPLLGQPSRLARGVYDPGPIQYWLLSVPVHIEPRAGALLGAALWCMVACSLAIEAARSAAGAAGGLLASAAVLGTVLWIPGIALNPLWNPWFGLMFFIAALATAWAVMCGRRGWWPVLMVAASIAAQAHLMYAIASGALVVLALIVGLTETIQAKSGFAGYRWLIIGVAAGLFCWSAPLVQEFTAQHGNLSALLRDSNGGAGHKGGISFGLQALAASIQPPPVWWASFSHLRSLAVASNRPVASGIVALVLIMAVLVAALWLRSRRTAAIAAVSLLVSMAAMITYASVPAGNISQVSTTFNNLTYLMAPMFAVGAAAWITVISGVILVARRAARVAPGPAAVPAAESATIPASGAGAPAAAGPAGFAPASPLAGPAARLARAPWARSVAALAAACVLISASLAISSLWVSPSQTAATNTFNYAIRGAAQKIQAKLPGQPIALMVLGRDRHYRRRLTFGLAYALHTMGYRPEVAQKYAWQLGPEFSYTGQPLPAVTVHMYQSGGIRVVVRHAPTGRPAATTWSWNAGSSS
jgi:hypothetical protein